MPFEVVENCKCNKITQDLNSKQIDNEKQAKITQDLNDECFKNSLKIGKYFIYKEKPIKMTSCGRFIDPICKRLSNYWTWRKVLSNGSLGIMGSDCNINDEAFKPITKQEAIKLAKELRRKMIYRN